MGRRRSIDTGTLDLGARSPSLSLHAVTAAALALALAACQDTVPPTSPLGARAPSLAAAPNAASDLIPDEYIVTFRDDVQDAPGLAKQLAAQHGATVRFTYTAAIKGFAAHMSAQAAVALQNNPQVAAVEPDRVAKAAGVQSAPPNWVLDRIDQRLRPMDNSFTYPNEGAGVNVYILDSGIRTTHTEFGGRATGAYTAIADGRGTSDCTGHGTHVAGIVGSAKYGVAKAARLYAVRVLDCSNSGSYSAFIAGIDWVTQNRVLPAVANMSLGGATSTAVNDAVQKSVAAGVVYVVSAGNSAGDACSQSPASAPAAITVGATDDQDTQSTYSNYGACVDLFAPGNNVLSTWYTSDSASFYASGTSMSSPHVAGAAALYLEVNPGAAPSQVVQALTSNATAGVLNGLGTGSPNLLLYIGALAPLAPAPAPSPSPTTTTTPVAATFTASCPKSICTLDASASSGGTAPYAFTWSFGDASTNATVTASKVSHQYRSKGSYVVTVTVTDANGQRSTAATTVAIKRL